MLLSINWNYWLMKKNVIAEELVNGPQFTDNLLSFTYERFETKMLF
ncbi:hypothetical protein [Bacillus thuringiensis]|nr:hypothetical protein [Bacillus thuringiensis]MDH4423565.1 hypothetical protein [Bacillus cereus]